jgi:cephalosporin hydroxylase
MKQLFVSYKMALALDGKGFNEPCVARYSRGQFEMNRLGDWYRHNSGEISQGYVSAPTIQQVLDWLDSKEIFLQPKLVEQFGAEWGYELTYITKEGSKWNTDEDQSYSNRTEATLAGIEFILNSENIL